MYKGNRLTITKDEKSFRAPAEFLAEFFNTKEGAISSSRGLINEKVVKEWGTLKDWKTVIPDSFKGITIEAKGGGWWYINTNVTKADTTQFIKRLKELDTQGKDNECRLRCLKVQRLLFKIKSKLENKKLGPKQKKKILKQLDDVTTILKS